MLLDESNVKKAIGAVAPRSKLSDPHIQAAIDYIAKNSKKTKQDIEQHLADKDKEYKDLEGKSKILYSAIAANINEQALRTLFREMKMPKPQGCAEFDPVTFSQLVRRVKAENPSFFPLRNFVDKKPLASPRIIIVPSSDPKDKHFNDISTAAATPQGEFIFNKDCMQDDMNFFYAQGMKAKGKKYKSNGGPFPDEWAPVEFTIMHEFFHYTHGDFHYAKVLGGNPTIHNWAQDFRSNHDLIKAGHMPYSEGLYSDYVNYDVYDTYKDMYEAVLNEFKKLNKDQQQKVQKALGGEGGEGKGSDHSHHGDEPQKPMPGQDAPTEKDLEKHSKGASKKPGEKQDGADPGKAEAEAAAKQADKGGRGPKAADQHRDVNWKGIKPRFNWKQLLEKLVRSADTTEVTYQKVHKRNITSVHLAAQTGAGVVRPGEKEVPANLVKLCIVVDSSGSMHGAIGKVLAEVNKLLGEGGVAKSFVFVEFSSDYHMFACTIAGKSGTARPIKDASEAKGGGGGKPENIATILSRHAGGATNFSGELTAQLDKFASMKYNILVLTDSDIAGGGNKEDFMALYAKHRQQVYLILDSRETFQSVAQTMKGASANMSHL
jgi:hypothetical protein